MTFNFPTEAPPEVVAWFKSKQLKPSFSWADVWKHEHRVNFTVAKAMKLDIVRDIHQAALKAFTQGQTLAQFRKELTPLLQKKGWWGVKEMTDPQTGEKQLAQLGSPRRLRVIYDTNLRTAHAAGQWDRIQRTKKTHPYLLYELGPSKEHRKDHVPWNRLLLPADDPFWDTHYPQNGWGCKCRVRQVSKSEYERIKGKSGTKAPKIDKREWTNKRTGEVMEVPKGIDPGWDYNPGKSRLKHHQKIVKKKEQQVNKQLSQPLPDLSIKAPAPFSTVKGVSGDQVNRLLNELGTDQSRKLFNDFLKVHPIKSVMAKATEIGGKRAWRNSALHSQVGEYLGVPAEEAFRQYGQLGSMNRTNGFTRMSNDLVMIKVAANTQLKKADSGKIKQATREVLEAATQNTGPRKIYSPVSKKYIPHNPDDYINRYWSVSSATGSKSQEQIMTTWIHEVGHQVHYWAGSPGFGGLSRESVLTEYSRTNKYEWFAEHFTAWYVDPVGVRQWNPQAAEFIETTIKEATRNTNPQLKGR